MAILFFSIVTLTIALLLIGRNKAWDCAPVSLLGLLFIVPVVLLVLGFI